MEFLSELARRTLDCRAEKIPEMLEHKRNGKIAFMLMDKLIVYDKPPDTQIEEELEILLMFLIMETLLKAMQVKTSR